MPTIVTNTATNALSTSARRVAVFFRPADGGRWTRVCTAPDRAAAVARINTAGNWWLHELPDEPTGPSLFDSPDDDSVEDVGGAR